MRLPEPYPTIKSDTFIHSRNAVVLTRQGFFSKKNCWRQRYTHKKEKAVFRLLTQKIYFFDFLGAFSECTKKRITKNRWTNWDIERNPEKNNNNKHVKTPSHSNSWFKNYLNDRQTNFNFMCEKAKRRLNVVQMHIYIYNSHVLLLCGVWYSVFIQLKYVVGEKIEWMTTKSLFFLSFFLSHKFIISWPCYVLWMSVYVSIQAIKITIKTMKKHLRLPFE